MTTYRERLWASPWVFVSTGLVIPASLLVFLPINPIAGPVVAVALYAAVVVLLTIGSPTIIVTETVFVAGRARLPLAFIGTVTPYREPRATEQRGPQLDARAWLLIRGWISPIVRIEITDPEDPTPYWIVSTRNPDALVTAIIGAQSSTTAD